MKPDRKVGRLAQSSQAWLLRARGTGQGWGRLAGLMALGSWVWGQLPPCPNPPLRLGREPAPPPQGRAELPLSNCHVIGVKRLGLMTEPAEQRAMVLL